MVVAKHKALMLQDTLRNARLLGTSDTKVRAKRVTNILQLPVGLEPATSRTLPENIINCVGLIDDDTLKCERTYIIMLLC